MALLFFSSLVASAQYGQRINTAITPVNSGNTYAKIIANPSVRVCVYNVQLACNDANAVAVFSDTALTNMLAQPFLGDVNGVYYYYIPSNTLVVEKVCAPYGQCTAYPVFISGASTSTRALTGTTGTITGTALTATCDSGTVSVAGAQVGQGVYVSSTTGADVGGAFNLRASVTSAGVVTVYVCGTGTPASLAYNVFVHQP